MTPRSVILSGTGGIWNVRTPTGEVVNAVLRGRLKKNDAPMRTDGSRKRDTDAAKGHVKLAVGDEVGLERNERDDTWGIAEIFPRRSFLSRREPGGRYGERVIASNMDQVVIVFAAKKPEPHPRMLDRFLVIAEANELPVRIVINKVELVGEKAARGKFGEYERVGYPLHFTSVKEQIGLQQLRDAMQDKTSVLTGPSGVGKSSLINSLFPGLDLRVGEISESVNKGRHTTVGASLHPLSAAEGAPGGYVADTPGLREVGMWALPSEHLDDCFLEMRGLGEQCRFGDCTHRAEPDCAVRQALSDGRISGDRYSSYVQLLEELETTEKEKYK